MSGATDINDRADIERLVNAFYIKVKVDPVIGHFFTEVVPLDWDKHMPLMYDFWETTLFHQATYKGNPIKVHQDLHEKSPLQKEHFDRWVELFNSTVDELFDGDKAELAKARALSIATVMQIKVRTA